MCPEGKHQITIVIIIIFTVREQRTNTIGDVIVLLCWFWWPRAQSARSSVLKSLEVGGTECVCAQCNDSPHNIVVGVNGL